MNFIRSITIAELWRPEVARRWKKCRFFFCIFWKKDPYGKIFKILFQIQSMCCVHISGNFKFREIWLMGKIGKIVRCLPDKKISPGSPALPTAWIMPKICHGQPHTMYSERSRFHPNRFTFGGIISKGVNTVTARSKVNPVFG